MPRLLSSFMNQKYFKIHSLNFGQNRSSMICAGTLINTNPLNSEHGC